jgi:hypothetical protein
MLTFELVNKKRSPAKRYAIAGALTGVACIFLIFLFHNFLPELFKTILMVAIAIDFVACLFILNYSIKFKNVVGHISFPQGGIEIELLQKKEFISNDEVRNIRFELVGYEGLNNTSIASTLLFIQNYFSYFSGLNNFVYIQTKNESRTFEIFLANKQQWAGIQGIAKSYRTFKASGNRS